MLRSGSSLRMALVNRAWSQWIALGVDAVGEAEVSVVDPEALIAVTAELGDTDARLRDLSTDWCVAFGRYVNGSRLKQVAGELKTPHASIGEYIATVASAGGPTWPMATRPRPNYATRGKARLETAKPQARLRIRLRAAFGVNARADVLAALLASPHVGQSVADLARRTRFTKPNVASSVDALVLAGLVDAQMVGNERRVTLNTKGPILPGLRPPVFQPDWVTRFGLSLALLRFVEQDAVSNSLRAIEGRRLVESMTHQMLSEGVPQPNLAAFGEAFAAAFDRWVVDVVYWLRLPASA